MADKGNRRASVGGSKVEEGSPGPKSNGSARSRRLSYPIDKNEKKPAVPSPTEKAASRRQSMTAAGRDGRVIAGYYSRGGDETYIYLRDNKMTKLDGIEVLRRAKVIDLSFNLLKNASLEPLASCKALQQLYLAGNQLASLETLPRLPHLEFLSVGQNKLTTLEMASQPKLETLVANSNSISTLRNFPYLPSLLNLQLDDNPIGSMQYLELALLLLVGPTLQTYNGLEVQGRDQAEFYGGHAAMCLRAGWDMCPPYQAQESLQQFLVSLWGQAFPPGYSLQSAHINSPQEEEPCRCKIVLTPKSAGASAPGNMTFAYQWLRASKAGGSFAPIPDAIKEEYWPRQADLGAVLRVECRPTVFGREYGPLFLVTTPVAQGSGIPRMLSVRVDGDAVEGKKLTGTAQVAWCSGQPGKSRMQWWRCQKNGEPVPIRGAEVAEYVPVLEDVGVRLEFEFTPVSVTGVAGESQSATTSPVAPAPPSVADVRVEGHAVLEHELTARAQYVGGREGRSRVEWLREDPSKGALKVLASGTFTFRPKQEDVGSRIAFRYTPVSSDGLIGAAVTVFTARVAFALPPKVEGVTLEGQFEEGSVVRVRGEYSGGHEGPSRILWLKSRSIDDDIPFSSLEQLQPEGTSKELRVPPEAAEYYLVAKYTPVRSDGEAGTPAYAIGPHLVTVLPPSVGGLNITGGYVEGAQLTASYQYVGGLQGKSECGWRRHKEEEDEEGSPIEETAGKLEYVVSKGDIGHFISFHCTPVREDGEVGARKSVRSTIRVLPGLPRISKLRISGQPAEGSELRVNKDYFGGDEGASTIQWYLTKPDGARREIKGAAGPTYVVRREDLDGLLSLSCVPERSDGQKGGILFSSFVGPVIPGEPRAESLSLPRAALEDVELVPTWRYFGGQEGEGKAYTPRVADVGSYLVLEWTPMRADGALGKPCQAATASPVVPAAPRVAGVGVKALGGDRYEGLGEYRGGRESGSSLQWYRQVETGEALPVKGATKRVYEAVEDDFGSRLVFGYTPRRSDGEVAPETRSEPSELIYPAAEIVDEGWEKYKKEVTYEWALSPSGEADSFQVSCSYQVRLKDVGQCLQCSCFLTDVFGRSAPVVRRSTPPVSAAHPRLEKLEIEGKGFHSSLYVLRASYYGGKEGSSRIQWYRQEPDQPEPIAIPGEEGRSYEATVDDEGCVLLAKYTPLRDDGEIGETVTAQTEPIEVDVEVAWDVNKIVNSGTAKFDTQQQGASAVERRVVDVNRRRIKVVKPGSRLAAFSSTEVKCPFDPPFRVETMRGDPYRLKVISVEHEVELVVQSRHARDVIALAVRRLAQQYLSLKQ
eukprot:jgi/Mesen1/1173/ME000124S00209